MENNQVAPITRFTGDQAQVLNKIESIYGKLRYNNINCLPYSKSALAKLAGLQDPNILNQIISSFKSLEDILGEPTPAVDPHDQEIFYIKKALNQLGMRVDDEFWNLLDHGDTVEIYGDDMIQRYRSFNFYNKTSYSLLDLVVNEWYVLWERPQSVLTELIQLANETISGKKLGATFINHTHLIREVYDSGQTQPFEPRVLEVKLKYSMPLYRSVGKTPNGFIVTSSCQIVSVGKDALNINFI